MKFPFVPLAAIIVLAATSLADAAPLAAMAAAQMAPSAANPAPAPAAGSFIRPADHRIISIGYRLGLGGRAHCPESFPLTGLGFHHLAEYRPQDHRAVIADYGLDRGLGILSVVEGSPAAQAGLAAADVILSVNGNAFPAPQAIAAERSERRRRARMIAAEELLEDHLRRGPARLEVLRGAVARTVTLHPVGGCLARARLARSDKDNAFADGRYAIMTTDFLGFFRNDDELAAALAHELAHNILRHPQELRERGVPTNFLRHIGRNAQLVRETEVAADLLSVRLLAGAGYDLDAVIPMWRRMERRLDSRLMIVSASPSLTARERYLSAAIAEVRGARPADAR